MEKVLILFVTLGLTGCFHHATKEVYIPVISCPAPPEFNRPTLLAEPNMSSGEFAKALHADFEAIKSYAESMEQTIDLYKELSKIKMEAK